MVKNPELSDAMRSMFDGRSQAWRERFMGGSPERERALFSQFERDIKRLQDSVQRRKKPGRPLRGFHAKLLLGVQARLEIEPTLAAELCMRDTDAPDDRSFLRQGATHRVSVRFSTSSHEVKSDQKRNGRGIALRIHDGDDFYDLLFSDSPASHARDAAQFMTFVKVLSAPAWKKPLPLLTELGPRESLRLLAGVWRQTFGAKLPLSATSFWGKTPMAINGYAVKYKLEPVLAESKPLAPRGSDFMRDDLKRRIQDGDVRYRLCIQRFVDEQRTPIEDHSKAWSETDAPLETIAHLIIERGAFDAQPHDAEAAIEQLEFNPWNTSPCLRPLGSFNRARKFVYAASADQRKRPPPQTGVDGLLRRLEEPFIELSTHVFGLVNKWKPWHQLPPALGVLNLIAIRHRMRHHNLHDAEDMVEPLVQPPAGCPMHQRDAQGRANDLQFPAMGSAERRFGRNVPRDAGLPEAGQNLLTPSPREISRRLLLRGDQFVPATSLNLLAAGWIQFQTHDWFAHDQRRDTREEIKLELAQGDVWKGGPRIVTPRTPLAPATPFEQQHQLPPTHQNLASHWWDGSQLYGSDATTTRSLRAHRSASLELTEAGLLPLGDDGLPLTGSNQNWWVGLELMHTLFAREHNAICAMLRRTYPRWTEDVIFEKARLTNVALMAKIHTVEWTPAILAHPTLELAMNAHWWGILGEKVQRRFGKLGKGELFGGIPGSRREHFEVPFALTEEFVSVYRLHPLLPDRIPLVSLGGGADAAVAFPSLAFSGSRQSIDARGLLDLAYSFGIAHPGAMCLHNYPRFLTELESPNEPIRDVGALDILRDRERGVPRYNRFRELLGLPRVGSYLELTNGDTKLANELEAVYGPGGIDRVDLLVGSLAETPPRGFGFGDTPFRVFVLMASRRLKSDRFFTDDYNEDTYTPEGLAWVRDNTMRHVLLRSFPELAPALRGVKNAFAPWNRVH